MEQRTENYITDSTKSGKGQYERKERGSYKSFEERKITIKHYVKPQGKIIAWGSYRIYENTPDSNYGIIGNPNIEDKFEQVNYPFYNVYVRISLKGQTTNLKTGIILPDDDNKLEKNSDLLENARIIKLILVKLKPFERDDFNIKEFTKIYDLMNSNVSKIILNILHNDYRRLLKDKMTELGFRKFSYNDDFSTSFIIDPIKDEQNSLLKYNEGIWCIQEYENILKKKLFRRNYYNPEPFFYSENNPFFFEKNFKLCTLVSFVDGTYQDEMIKMFGKEVIQPIIDDIYIILKQNFEEFKIIF